MMEWEIQKKMHFATKPPSWGVVPAISIGKNGITWNVSAMKAYGLTHHVMLSIFLDREREHIGFKQAESQEDLMCAWPLKPTSGSHKTRAGYLCCGSVVKRIAGSVGKSYRLNLNPGERIIMATLSPEGELSWDGRAAK